MDICIMISELLLSISAFVLAVTKKKNRHVGVIKIQGCQYLYLKTDIKKKSN